MMPIERNSRVVFGIDDQRKDGDLGAQGPQNRVCEKCAAELAPLEGLVDRKAPNPGDRDRWIPWQSLRQALWQVGQRHAACGQGVVAGDGVGFFLDGDKARTGTTACILRGLRSEVPIQRRDAAFESGSIVLRPEDLKSKICGHFDSRTSRPCA